MVATATPPQERRKPVPVNFGGLEPQFCDPDKSQVWIWPVPYEATTSYGSGTSDGPKAIIEASRHMESYDEEIGAEPAVSIGIHTLPAIRLPKDPAKAIEAIESNAKWLLGSGKFLVALGGEHTITAPIVRAFAKQVERLSVLQIDAHLDIKKLYAGSDLGHASVMRHVLEVCPAVQVGIRSVSVKEVAALPEMPTEVFYAKDIVGRTEWVENAVNALSENVYLTIDVDGFDPSLVPATGCPEPGGLSWHEVLALIETTALNRRIVGMDVVELCDGHPPSAVLVSRLILKTIGWVFRDKMLPPDPSIPDAEEE